MGKKKAKGSLGMQWFTTGVSTTLVLILLGIVSFLYCLPNVCLIP